MFVKITPFFVLSLAEEIIFLSEKRGMAGNVPQLNEVAVYTSKPN
jgi:hypothetical protein